jgi:hypothetical protein
MRSVLLATLQIHHDLSSRTQHARTSDVRRGDVDVASARHSGVDRADIVLLGSWKTNGETTRARFDFGLQLCDCVEKRPPGHTQKVL